ncbi:MAG TPA: hypothetical protein VG244_10225 [Acidimicrobiales bacterium]|nr:hypothetical protein [Acidimicrobiales bacterium]
MAVAKVSAEALTGQAPDMPVLLRVQQHEVQWWAEVCVDDNITRRVAQILEKSVKTLVDRLGGEVCAFGFRLHLRALSDDRRLMYRRTPSLGAY